MSVYRLDQEILLKKRALALRDSYDSTYTNYANLPIESRNSIPPEVKAKNAVSQIIAATAIPVIEPELAVSESPLLETNIIEQSEVDVGGVGISDPSSSTNYEPINWNWSGGDGGGFSETSGGTDEVSDGTEETGTEETGTETGGTETDGTETDGTDGTDGTDAAEGTEASEASDGEGGG